MLFADEAAILRAHGGSEWDWDEVLPGAVCRRIAERMLRVHPRRAADALQLAAATVAADHDPSRLEFVGLDPRLSEASRKEVLPPVSGT